MLSFAKILPPLLALFVLSSCLKTKSLDEGTTAAAEVPEDIVRAYTINPATGEEIMLAMPSYNFCVNGSRVTLSLDGKFHFAFLSNDFDQSLVDPDNREKKNKTYTWIEARDACRRKCMDLVALDDPVKNAHLMRLLKGKTGVWTAGKRCLFDECGGVLEPVHLNGWYWASTYEKIPPADEIELGWPENPWGRFGILDTPQPDNAENSKDPSVIEACLAVKTAPKSPKPAWHDLPCNMKLGAVCEAAPQLTQYILESSGLRAVKDVPPV